MTEDELVEQLKRRLDEVVSEIPDSFPTRDHAIQAVARECLRQMHWMRETGYDDGFSDGAADEPGSTPCELSLAPPEWTP